MGIDGSAVKRSAGTLRILILGAGKGGKALLELFACGPRVEVVGIADTNPQAPGLVLACNLGVPTATDVPSMIAGTSANLIVDVTGDPAMAGLIAQAKPASAEVLSGTAARLVWNLAQYERELRDQLIQAEKLASIGTVASGIAHEINNPLYGITGLSERLETETRPEVVKEYLRDIKEMSGRISRIVKDLNAYARKHSAKDQTDIDVNRTIEEAVKMSRRATVLNEVQVVTDFAPVPPFRGHPDELLQVFLNIVTNAMQAMEGRGNLTVTTRSVNGTIHASVEDSGPGIPSHVLGKIFDPFFTTKDQGQGTGLGLHIVRDIVMRCGGKVTVHSESGKGATFTVTLPVAA
jgi:two-component system NtrC family sensor kinase